MYLDDSQLIAFMALAASAGFTAATAGAVVLTARPDLLVTQKGTRFHVRARVPRARAFLTALSALNEP